MSSKRSKIKYPALRKEYNIKARQEFMDAEEFIDGVYDEEGNELIRPLTDEEKEWYNQFYREYYNASLSNAEYHTTPELRKDCYDRNNARNRCLYSRNLKLGMMDSLDVDEYNDYLENKVHNFENYIYSMDDLVELKKRRKVNYKNKNMGRPKKKKKTKKGNN